MPQKVTVQVLKLHELPATLDLPDDDPRRWMITTYEYPVKNTSGATRDEAIEKMCLEIFRYLYYKRTS